MYFKTMVIIIITFFFAHEDCTTRWGSKQIMIERMLEQTAINRVLADDRKANVSITWQDEDVLQSVNKALKPVSEFTDILSGEDHVTVSSLLPMLHLIKEDTLAPSNEDGQLTANLKAGIIAILDEKYKALPEASQELMHKATFLYPCYQGNCDPNVEETKRMIEEEVEEYSQLNLRQNRKKEKRMKALRSRSPKGKKH